MDKSRKVETPEDRQIAAFNTLKDTVEDEARDIKDTIDDLEEVLTVKSKKIDMLDFLIAKLKERIAEAVARTKRHTQGESEERKE